MKVDLKFVVSQNSKPYFESSALTGTVPKIYFKTEIESKFKSIGWERGSDGYGTLNKVNYNDLRNILIIFRLNLQK